MERDERGFFVNGHKVLPGSERGWFKKGTIPWSKTNAYSKESREKMSVSQKRRFAGKPLLGDQVYLVKCPICKIERKKDRGEWLVAKKTSGKCRACSLKTRTVNSGCFKKGIKPWNYKTSKRPFCETIKHTAEWKSAREAVFRRDDFTCVLCGARGGQLHPDHILPKATHPELVFEIKNIRTLCVPCHRKTDTYGAKASKLKALARSK